MQTFHDVCPGSSDDEFASALYHFNHSLVTSDLPSPALQVRVEWIIRLTKRCIRSELSYLFFFVEHVITAAWCGAFLRRPLAYVHPATVSVGLVPTAADMAA